MSVLSDAQFQSLKDVRSAAQKAVYEAQAAQQRHPGPLGDLAYTEAVKAQGAAHNDMMREYHRRAWEGRTV
jgi:hypothetical protein